MSPPVDYERSAMLMDYALMGLIVAAITILWPVNSWAMRQGARSQSMGMAAAVTGLLVAIPMTFGTHEPLVQPLLSVLGGIAGLGFGIGYCLIIFHCLRIGPVGPTAMLNNLGLLWPIAIGLIFFPEEKITPHLLMGLSLTILAIVLMAWVKPERQHTNHSRRWLAWALLGWVGAGLSGSCQYLAGKLAPGMIWPFMIAFFGGSSVVLLIAVKGQQASPHGRIELLAGMANGGLLGGLIVPLTITLSHRLPVAVFFPVTQAAPIVGVLLIGRFFMNEHLTRTGWLACTCGIVGIILLNI